MQKLLLFIVVLCLLSCAVQAQIARTDSLLLALKSEESKENKQKVDVWNELAWEFRDRQPKKAVSYADSALQLAKKLEYEKGKATALNYLGVVYGKDRKYKEAIDNYQQSLSIRQQLKDESAIINTLYNLAITYEKQGNFSKAIEYYDALTEAYNKQKNQKELIETYFTIADICKLQLKNYEKAVFYLQKILDIASNTKALSLTYRTYKAIREVYYAQADKREIGIQYHYKSLEAIEAQINQASNKVLQRSYTHLYQQDLLKLVHIFIKQNDQPNIDKYCQKILEINQKNYTKNTTPYLTCYKNVADAYKQAGQNQKALDLYEQIVNIAPTGTSNIFFWPSEMLEVAVQMKAYPTALRYAQKSIIEEFDFSYMFAKKSYYHITKPEQLGKDVMAIYIGLEGLDSTRQHSFEPNFKYTNARFDEVASYVRDLAYIHKFIGNQTESEEYYQKFINIYQSLINYLEENRQNFIRQDLLNERINLSKKIIRNVEGELVFFDKIDAEKRLQESIAQRLKAEKKVKEEETAFLMQTNTLLETSRKQEMEKNKALQLAHNEETEKNKVLSQKNRLLTENKFLNERISYALALILLLAIALAFVLYWNSRKHKKANQKLQLKNEEINRKSTEILLQKNEIEIQKNLVDAEREKADNLLLNILPLEIAKELKETGQATPHFYEKVTVLFTDFKGFTQHAEKLSAQEVIKQLNDCFLVFDEICERYNLEKIKTIGDAYMCAGGLPIPNDNNPIDAVKAGLEMQAWVQKWQIEKKLRNEEIWELRVGIHTGNVIAGVIGKNKFAYDIWGDAVNLAARMESSGEVGRVNISGTTYELVKEQFKCVYRGKIKAKSKGEIDMYFVEG